MWFTACAAAVPPAVPRHVLEVALDPAGHTLSVTDTLTLPEPPSAEGIVVLLHAGLSPRVDTKGWELLPETVPADLAAVPVEGWRLRATRRTAAWPVRVTYQGVLHHPPEQVATEYQRSFATSPGVLGPDGVVLSGESMWVPQPVDEGGLVTFELTVRGLPGGWGMVSQGERASAAATTYRMDEPTEGIHLVAGPWTEYAARYERPDGTGVDVRAFLRTPDETLAQGYLDATKADLALYESMLRPYPYASFALVENAWETGYGMPGFTLLGPEVIRFPFVITSSYPHELLHNWWGNGVYVAPASGNWCEGLTAYLADHLFAEQRGEGAVYRRSTLQKYGDFVGEADVLPLSEFRGRDSAESEAVGYGKTLMVFHMLRRSLGDVAFLGALKRFDDAHRFGTATWGDLAAAVSAETGREWGAWFTEWTTRPGAPALMLGATDVKAEEGKYTLSLTLRQDQPERVFPVDVPVAVTLAGEAEARLVTVRFLEEREVTVTETFDHAPLRVDVDPAFDVMRRLHPLEVPPALSSLFGEGVETFVVPAKAPAAEQEAWKALAAAWAKPAEPTIVTDAVEALPAGNVWVLGWDNRFATKAVGGQEVARAGHSIVTVERAGDAVIGRVAADPVDAVPGLIRKLPHYTKYSWLVFDGAEPKNSGKGMVESVGAPTTRMLGATPVPAAKLPVRAPLAPAP